MAKVEENENEKGAREWNSQIKYQAACAGSQVSNVTPLMPSPTLFAQFLFRWLLDLSLATMLSIIQDQELI